MGAGSIGCYVGGRLLAADAAEVTFIGRERTRAMLAEHPMRLSAIDLPSAEVPVDRLRVETDPEALADCDAVLVCVKSAQTEEVGRRLASIVGDDTVVASFQNGVRNPATLRESLGDRVLPAIVGFNVVSRPEGAFHQGTTGPLSLQAPTSEAGRALVRALEATGLDVETHDDLAPHQWTKLMVNLNNAVSALSGAPTRDLLLVPEYRRVVAAVVQEGLQVTRGAGVRVAALRGIPIGVMPTVLRLPTPIVRLVTRRQMRVDPEARSSMWEDLSRRRPTEIDYLNGEIVRLARAHGLSAPINRRVVELVREAEAKSEGPPGLSGEALWEALHSD